LTTVLERFKEESKMNECSFILGGFSIFRTGADNFELSRSRN
jgi:hypothetical protein